MTEAKLDRLKAAVDHVYEVHGERISTHYEGCWVYHAGCLAAMLKGIIDEGGGQ